MYVLDLFVKVPPSATTPIRYEPVEVDAINPSHKWKRAKETSHFQLQ